MPEDATFDVLFDGDLYNLPFYDPPQPNPCQWYHQEPDDGDSFDVRLVQDGEDCVMQVWLVIDAQTFYYEYTLGAEEACCDLIGIEPTPDPGNPDGRGVEVTINC